MRFGIAARTDCVSPRRTIITTFYNLNASGLGSGFGDLALGVNEQLGPTPGGFGVSVPQLLDGASGVSSGGYDPGLQVTWSHGLSSKWTAVGMFSLYGPTQDHKRNLTGQSTLLLNRQLTPPWAVFVEYVVTFRNAVVRSNCRTSE